MMSTFGHTKGICPLRWVAPISNLAMSGRKRNSIVGSQQNSEPGHDVDREASKTWLQRLIQLFLYQVCAETIFCLARKVLKVNSVYGTAECT